MTNAQQAAYETYQAARQDHLTALARANADSRYASSSAFAQICIDLHWAGLEWEAVRNDDMTTFSV